MRLMAAALAAAVVLCGEGGQFGLAVELADRSEGFLEQGQEDDVDDGRRDRDYRFQEEVEPRGELDEREGERDGLADEEEYEGERGEEGGRARNSRKKGESSLLETGETAFRSRSGSKQGTTYETVHDLVSPQQNEFLKNPVEFEDKGKYLPRFMQTKTSLAETILDASTAETEGTTSVNVDSSQLDAALNEIKNEVVKTSAEIKQEQNWVGKVDEMITTYTTKKNNVNANILKLKQQLVSFIKDKRRINNLKLQAELQSKLKDASSDMSTLKTALTAVQKKQVSFQKTESSLQGTIDKLTAALKTLQGSSGASNASSTGGR